MVVLASLSGRVAHAKVDWSQNKPHATSEAECTKVDLRPAVGPARNQGNIGWCYANVTADLLTFRYRKELGTKRVSAGYTALIYNKGNEAPPLGEGGAVDQAIDFATREGLCTEDLEGEVMSRGPKMAIKQKLDAFIRFKRLYDEGRTNPKSKAAFQLQVRQYRSSNSSLFKLKQAEILRLLATTDQKTFPLEFARMLCKGHEVMATPPYPDMATINKQDLAKFWVKLSPYIHQQLEDGKPVAVGYAAQFLSQEKVPNWRFSWTSTMRGVVGDVSRHASLIVGRRWNGKKC